MVAPMIVRGSPLCFLFRDLKAWGNYGWFRGRMLIGGS